MTNYEKLQTLITEIDVLIQQNITSNSPDFKDWRFNTEFFLEQQFGESSNVCQRFKHTYFSNWFAESDSDRVSACKSGLEKTKQLLSFCLKELKDMCSIESGTSMMSKPVSAFQKVFVVHGHDTGLKEALARLLERQGIEPVSLQEKANPGLATIIEKFETNSADVDAAICLFTADDVGGLATSKKRTKRARQNVVLETGFFIGKLGRDRVIIIKEDGVEIPSDLAGVDLPTANKADWKSTVLQALEKIGYAINYQIAFSKNR